ncbi:MAG: TraR/DksA family transcriptional regulator [Myxococcales bacterium]|nr:TraR/DksA family transcriptional regulator [Myxococcales bacterium]
MDHLSAAEVAELRQLLEREREALLRRAGAFVSESAAFEVDSGDRQDAAQLEAARAALAGLASHDRRRLAEVEAALARIADGTYGICEETDEPIPAGRLRLQPTARYTVEAQQTLEEEAARDRESGGDGGY